MTVRAASGASSYLLLALAGCTQGAGQGASPPISNQPEPARVSSHEETTGPGHLESAETPHPLADERKPDPDRALPELTYRHLGMHIGGESNTPESKRPWLDDIEEGIVPILQCYRLVDEPTDGGSYGVDLYVGRDGGAPEVRASRQKLGGEKFDDCMRRAFSSLDFHEPERPTVLSYSILFSLGE